MTNEFKIISEDGLKTLCKAIKKVSTIGEIIDDDNSVTDKTYSSFEIDRRLNTKIDKTQLTTVLDENVTDEQIPSAKAVVDSVNEAILERITPIIMCTQLSGTFQDAKYNVSHENTITEVVRKIANYYIAKYGDGVHLQVTLITNSASTLFSKSLPSGGESSMITISYCPRVLLSRIRIESTSLINGTKHIGTLNNSDTGDIVWSRVCTTKVTDVDKVTITTQNLIAGIVSYFVKNGICYVSISGITPSLNGGSTIITANTLPLPNIKGCNHYTIGTTSGVVGLFVISNNGSATFYGQNTLQYFGQFSYPVAE